uniref:Uncharacterized protein n=1 Tax=Rhizophora mucronata TaxID=61149 RepID=A0A2P2P3N5_RHIMU
MYILYLLFLYIPNSGRLLKIVLHFNFNGNLSSFKWQNPDVGICAIGRTTR